MKKYLAEFFGTMFLVLFACGSAVLAAGSNGQIGALGVGICFGLVLLCLCYAIGGISGCHVNPAVSFAIYLTDKNFSCKDFCGYVVAQLLGASVGAAFLFLFMYFGNNFDFGGITHNVECGSIYLAANVLQPGTTWQMALLAEILFTFFFVFVILGATSKLGNSNLAGVAIGFALGLVNIVGIPVDNCSVNPARSFGPALFTPGAWCDFWIMVVGPIVGALLAAAIWRGLSQGVKASNEITE